MLSICLNWLAGLVVLNVKWAFSTRFSHKSTINSNVYYSPTDWLDRTNLTNNRILFSNIPVWQASSDKWKVPYVKVQCTVQWLHIGQCGTLLDLSSFLQDEATTHHWSIFHVPSPSPSQDTPSDCRIALTIHQYPFIFLRWTKALCE